MSVLAVSASASEFTRSGVLDWSYEELAVMTPGGTRRVSSWNQAYTLSLFGPLGHDLFGEGSESVSFSQGSTLSQLASNANSKEEVLGYSLSWALFPPLIRRYVRFNPSLARTRSSLVWGQPVQMRTLVDSVRSLDLGLTVPSFPTVDVQRSLSSRKDESSAPIIDQRTSQGVEEVNYVRGPLYARYRHEQETTDDRLVASGRVFSDQTDGEMNLSFQGIKHGLDSAFLRTTFQERKSGFASNARLLHQMGSEMASVTSQRWQKGAWTSYVFGSEEFSRDFAGRSNMEQGNVSLSSLRSSKSDKFRNSLSYARGAGTIGSENVTDSIFLDHRMARALYHLDGSGGWARTQGVGITMKDSMLQRLTFAVVRNQTLYIEQGTEGLTPLSGQSGGIRTHSAALGSEVRYNSIGSFSSRYHVARTAELGGGFHSVRHEIINEGHASPYPGLTAILLHNYTWNVGPPGAPVRLGYLNAEIDDVVGAWDWTGGYSTNFLAAYDAFLGASFTIGKTTLQMRGERKGLAGPLPYWLWSVRIRRVL